MESKSICKICKKECINLNHLSKHIRVHKISIQLYYDQFFKNFSDGICIVCKNPTRFNGLRCGYRMYCSVKCVQLDSNIQDKKKQTCFERFGVTHNMLSEKSKSLIKQTNILRYGVEHPTQNKEVMNRIRSTNLKKYGVEIVTQADEIKEKSKKTCQKKYGSDYASSSKLFRVKVRKTFMENYGVDNPSKHPDIIRKIRDYHIHQIEKQRLNGEPLMPCIGDSERECLNELENLLGLTIERNPRIIGFFPDGRIEDLKLLIEFDENHHFSIDGSYTDRDVRRQKELEDFGYVFFRVKKSEWEENKDMVVRKLQEMINAGIVTKTKE